MLAHKGRDGVVAAEGMAGQQPHVDYNLVPHADTAPEVASVGATEDQLKADGVDYSVWVSVLGEQPSPCCWPYHYRGRVLADATTDRVLGRSHCRRRRHLDL